MQPVRLRFLLVEINYMYAKVNESSREFRRGARAPFLNSSW